MSRNRVAIRISLLVAAVLLIVKVPTIATFDGLSLLVAVALIVALVLWVEETA